ncbi:MAG: P-loop NTPase [Spirochaetales bacterium]
MYIVPIASGKGGVGKTLLAGNLALALGQAGKRVVLCDLDLGGSNLHLVLGIPPVEGGLGAFIHRPDLTLEDIILETEYPNVRFVPGDGEMPGAANLTAAQKHRIRKSLLSLETDYLLLDLGAGTHLSILDFFLLSRRGVVITTPTPMATVNAYLFLKNVLFRLLSKTMKKKSEAYQYLETLRKEGTALQNIYLPKLLEEIQKRDKETYHLFQQHLANFQPRLVLNLVEDPRDAEKAHKLRRSCLQYLNLDLEHLGIIYRDNLQDIALSSRLPLLMYKPQSVLSTAIRRITDKLIQSEGEEDSFPSMEETFQEASLEAEVDYEAKMDYLQELLHTGALTTGDLIETVKMQQIEINQLKKENSYLKAKLVNLLKGA